jgi:glycosyltransferase involved in cell wall biosynthesis
LKILLLSTTDTYGGAAKAAYRLHKGFQSLNVDSNMLVMSKHSEDNSIVAPQSKLEKLESKILPTLEGIPLKIFQNSRSTPFSVSWAPNLLSGKVRKIQPDVINLHWCNAGFLHIESLSSFGRPIFWTLHDMWAFTGGCHYSLDCCKYINECTNCQYLNDDIKFDLSKWIWNRKLKTYQKSNLTIITLSSWLYKVAKSSLLLKDKRIELIPNGINTKIYKPIQKPVAKAILNLALEKKVILFGAMNAVSDERKGFHFLCSALKLLKQSNYLDNISVMVFGASGSSNAQTDFDLNLHYLGQLVDDVSITTAYSAADVVVVPSIQDNLPNIILEAMSCGTPCVAFNVGGASDLIEHNVNGYLAKPFDIADLAEGIKWILDSNDEKIQILSSNARRKIEVDFNLEKITSSYLKLFAEVL